MKCLPTQGTNGTFSDGVQTYNGSTWETTTPCTLNCNSGFVKKTGTDWRQYCANKEEQCKIWQYKEGNICKDRILKITIRNDKNSAPFPTEACTVSDDNKLILLVEKNWWDEEKELSACTEGFYVFTGAISYSFSWRIKPTRDFFRMLRYWSTNNLITAISRDRDAPTGFDFDWGQSLPNDFTTGEVVIENVNIPITTKTAPKDERFNIDLNEWWYRKPEAETLEKIREKYAIPQDINHIQCRLTNHKDVGFYKGPTWTEIFDSNNSRDIKEELKSTFYNDYLNKKLEKTLIRWSSLYHWSYDWYRGRRRSLSYNDHEWGESDFYVWYVEVKDENVILHRWPVTCDPEIWYIGPKLGEDKFKLNSNFDFSIRLGTKEGLVTYDKK